MTRTEEIRAEFDRRAAILQAAGYHVHEYGYEDLIILEVFVKDAETSENFIRKQEAVAFRGRSKFLVECRKLMALERLIHAVPRMWVAQVARAQRESPQS